MVLRQRIALKPGGDTMNAAPPNWRASAVGLLAHSYVGYPAERGSAGFTTKIVLFSFGTLRRGQYPQSVYGQHE